ncbi:MAG: SLBB domain-containing protein [Syntrophobacterales bacterium]|nr:MAG: SLBB domain-containing protein [Syntrophobacterales bacterium]
MQGKIIHITVIIGIALLMPVSAPTGAQVMDSQKGDFGIVMELIERWKEKAEQGGLEHYLSRYGTPSQRARGRKGEQGQFKQVDITIGDVRVFKRDDGVITTTFLRRANSIEFRDVGVGMLSFTREDGIWKIGQEKWYPLSEEDFAGGMAYTVTIGPGNAPRVIINNPERKGQRKREIPKKKVASSKKEASANPDIGEYTIGAGDVLLINVWGHGDLTKEVVVSEKGKFSFPLIGEVEAAGLTAKELEGKLVHLLSDGYVIDPNVSVRIKGFMSKKVYVLGQVRSPGTYSLHKETSLIEIISMAGGVTDGAGWIIEVVRPSRRMLDKPITPDEAKKEDIIHVDVEGLLGGRPEDNIKIEGGDTIFVPKAAYYFIFGEVRKPGSYKLRRETTVLKAVILAGGFTEKASKRRIKIRRTEEGKTIKVRVKLDDPILPQDTIIVPESFF